jgi:hypothetical protein
MRPDRRPALPASTPDRRSAGLTTTRTGRAQVAATMNLRSHLIKACEESVISAGGAAGLGAGGTAANAVKTLNLPGGAPRGGIDPVTTAWNYG